MKKDPDMVPRNPHALETFAEDILSLDDQRVYQYAHLRLSQCWHILKY